MAATRRGRAPLLRYFFETVLRAILAHFAGFENLTTHRDIDAWFRNLHGRNRHADIEDRIGRFEPCRRQGARQHDRLVLQVPQRLGRLRHRIRAMRDNEKARMVLLDEVAQLAAIRGVDLETVLMHQRHNLEIEFDAPLSEDMLHLRFADLELAEVVKVDFIDCAAGGNEPNKHRARRGNI